MSGRFTPIEGGGGGGAHHGEPPKLEVLDGHGNDDGLEEAAPGVAPDQMALQQKLAELRQEHRDLDDVIDRLAATPPYDQLQIQRLKKRKLGIKDQLVKLESALLPDIIA